MAFYDVRFWGKNQPLPDGPCAAHAYLRSYSSSETIDYIIVMEKTTSKLTQFSIFGSPIPPRHYFFREMAINSRARRKIKIFIRYYGCTNVSCCGFDPGTCQDLPPTTTIAEIHLSKAKLKRERGLCLFSVVCVSIILYRRRCSYYIQWGKYLHCVRTIYVVGFISMLSLDIITFID